MNHHIQKLIKKSIESFEGNPWLGSSLMNNLKSINFQLVNERLPQTNKSIAILVQHIINWRIFVLEKIAGNQLFDIQMDSEKDWTEVVIKNETEWIQLLDDLISTQHQLIKILKEQEDDHFLSQVVSGRTYDFEYLIEGIIQHDTYHGGQIGLLASMINEN